MLGYARTLEGYEAKLGTHMKSFSKENHGFILCLPYKEIAHSTCKCIWSYCPTQKPQQGVLELHRRLHSKSLPTCTSRGPCRRCYLRSQLRKELLKQTTFPCKGTQWSRFLSSFQESIWTSASPRKVFLPKRPWCQTENCKVLWARRDSGISYCERKGEAQDD